MLAVTSRYRLHALPDVPTMQEAGLRDYDVTGWLGVMGPAGLPASVRDKLSTALVEILRDAETQAQVARPSVSSRSAPTRRHSIASIGPR